MLELTQDECLALEDAVIKKLIKDIPEKSNFDRFAEVISHLAIQATIMTIREYERMKADLQDAPQPAE